MCGICGFAATSRQVGMGNYNMRSLSEDRQVTATFGPIRHTLSLDLQGTGGGRVTSDPAGIDCPDDCSEGYLDGTSVTLTATPAAGLCGARPSRSR